MTTCAGMSLSARRAWIEILCLPDIIAAGPVALRKESVDRNPMAARTSSRWSVALRKESVDRNPAVCLPESDSAESLSARRAWIEILTMDTPNI